MATVGGGTAAGFRRLQAQSLDSCRLALARFAWGRHSLSQAREAPSVWMMLEATRMVRGLGLRVHLTAASGPACLFAGSGVTRLVGDPCVGPGPVPRVSWAGLRGQAQAPPLSCGFRGSWLKVHCVRVLPGILCFQFHWLKPQLADPRRCGLLGSSLVSPNLLGFRGSSSKVLLGDAVASS